MPITQKLISTKATLNVAINSTDVSLVLGAGEGADFPSADFPYTLIIQWIGRIEVATLTARAGDTLTVTRGDPASSFSPGASVRYCVIVSYPDNGVVGPYAHTHTLADITDEGDLAALDTVGTPQIDDDAVTNAKLAHMALDTIKGYPGGGDGSPMDMSTITVTAMLEIFTAVLQGLVPASGGGTTNFLRADGAWAAPGGGPGGGAAMREAIVNVPSPTRETTVVVTDALITAGMFILAGWGAIVETDQNSPGMDNVSFSAVAGSGNFTLRMASKDPLFGNFRINYAVA